MATEQAKKMWNYIPDLPIQVSPYFRKPFNIINIIKWMFLSWFPMSDRLVVLLLATISLLFFTPDLATTKEFAFGWIFQIYIRNVILLTLGCRRSISILLRLAQAR